MDAVGIVDIDYWRKHVTEHVVTTEQALSFLDDIAACRATIVRLRAELDEAERDAESWSYAMMEQGELDSLP